MLYSSCSFNILFKLILSSQLFQYASYGKLDLSSFYCTPPPPHKKKVFKVTADLFLNIRRVGLTGMRHQTWGQLLGFYYYYSHFFLFYITITMKFSSYLLYYYYYYLGIYYYYYYFICNY